VNPSIAVLLAVYAAASGIGASATLDLTLTTTLDYAHYGRGDAEGVSPHVRDVAGVDPRDAGRFAEDDATTFAGT
jgi:hypothetical protein